MSIPDFLKCSDSQRIERPRFESSALRFKEFTAHIIEQRGRHLAAGAVMHPDEENLLLHELMLNQANCQLKRH
jgi:hypothetical protein